MEKIINSIPGYKVYEYLLVLSPHEELRNRIMQVKKDFFETYKNASAVYGKPHITLVNFMQYGQMENRILNRLQLTAMGFQPVRISLKDYGSFPAHTIYINVTSKLPIQSLVKTLRAETQKLMKLNNDHKPHFILEPHLTIARKLQPWQFEQGWQSYNHRNFTGSFIADSMLLLKRPVGEMKYEIIKRFDFQNLPGGTKQGDLFN